MHLLNTVLSLLEILSFVSWDRVLELAQLREQNAPSLLCCLLHLGHTLIGCMHQFLRMNISSLIWCTRLVPTQRPSVLQTDALPTELRVQKFYSITIKCIFQVFTWTEIVIVRIFGLMRTNIELAINPICCLVDCVVHSVYLFVRYTISISSSLDGDSYVSMARFELAIFCSQSRRLTTGLHREIWRKERGSNPQAHFWTTV